MHITQIDNRRVHRARRQYESAITNHDSSLPSYCRIVSAGIRLSWHIDQQSARIARRWPPPVLRWRPRILRQRR